MTKTAHQEKYGTISISCMYVTPSIDVESIQESRHRSSKIRNSSLVTYSKVRQNLNMDGTKFPRLVHGTFGTHLLQENLIVQERLRSIKTGNNC